MSWFAVTILLVGGLFIASRVVRLAHLVDVLRSVSPESRTAEAEVRARELAAVDGEDGDDAETVGVALALALREAEAEARGRDMDAPV